MRVNTLAVRRSRPTDATMNDVFTSTSTASRSLATTSVSVAGEMLE